MVLALVSRPRSSERALCLALFEKYKLFADQHNAVPNPIGGSRLDFDIPWDRLDAYSAEMEQQRREDVIFFEPQLYNSAPEWNWWYMLKRIDLKSVCEWKTHTSRRYSQVTLVSKLILFCRACHRSYDAHGDWHGVLGLQ